MSLPRIFKIMRLIQQAARSFMRNEPYTLSDSLMQLDDLGGVYIKFLQMIVLQMDPQSQRNFNSVLSVYEHSKPDQLAIGRYLWRHSPQLMANMARLEPQPFATGSFGQVYRAVLTDGTPVVIKVLRPSVIRHLRADLNLLGFMAFWIGVFDRQKLFNFRNIYREFRRTSLMETNYRHEAAVASAYHQEFAAHPTLVIPYTYREFSSARVLVQQEVSGLSVAQLLERQAGHGDARQFVWHTLNSDLHAQLRTIGVELLSKALFGATFHADPHPGNIILMPGNKVALIDFGMTSVVRDDRLAFYELLLEYQKFYTGKLEIENFMIASLKMLEPELYQALRYAGELFGTEKKEELLEHLRDVAKAAADAEEVQPMINYFMERRMIMRILAFVVNKQNRFGFSFDMRSAVTLKAIQTFIVLTLKFDKESHIIRAVIDDVVATANQHMDEIAESSAGKSLRPQDSAEVLSHWFDKIARNDPWFLQQVAGKYLK